MKSTLFKYIVKMQSKSLFLASLFFFGLIVVFNFAEVSRKSNIVNLSDFIQAIQLAILSALSVFASIMHYIYFITSTFCLWHLCQSHQLVILKSSGQSPLQILYPFISYAIFIAGIWMFALQPLGIYGKELCNNIKNNNAEYNENIWIEQDNQLIFIKKIHDKKITDFYSFNTNNDTKIIADNAEITNNKLTAKNGIEIINNKVKSFDEKKYTNYISDDLIKMVSIPLKKQTIYTLSKVYNLENESGTTLREYSIELQKLFVNFFTFILFALISAVICFPINRYQSKTDIVVKVISIAMVLRFVNSIFESIAYHGLLPISQAVWGPILIVSCIAIAILVWREA